MIAVVRQERPGDRAPVRAVNVAAFGDLPGEWAPRPALDGARAKRRQHLCDAALELAELVG